MSRILRAAAVATALTGCLFAAPALLAQQEAPEYQYWSSFQLDNLGRSLAGEAGAGVAILDRLIDREHYFAAVVHREPGPGVSESHADWADVYFVTSGNASLIVGGTITDGEETEPGEVRGSVIEGGTLQRLAKGDVVHIPAGTAHHVRVEPGEQVTYYVLKVKQP